MKLERTLNARLILRIVLFEVAVGWRESHRGRDVQLCTTIAERIAHTADVQDYSCGQD